MTQEDKNINWNLNLLEISIYAERPMKEIEVQLTKIDSVVLKENIALSVADILTFNTPIFVKNYGRATLSAVAFRDTSASYTQVSWKANWFEPFIHDWIIWLPTTNGVIIQSDIRCRRTIFHLRENCRNIS